MQRLTAYISGYAHGRPGRTAEKAEQSKKVCRGEFDATGIVDRLAALEDILYTPDGSERITLDRLAELVTAEVEGRAVVLPCKVGDVLYCVTHDGAIKERQFDSATVYLNGEDFMIHLDLFGRVVFLTRAEAEAKGEQP